MEGSLGAELLVVPVLTVMTALLGAQISPGGIWVWKNVARDQILELLHRINKFIYFYWLLLFIIFQMLSLSSVSPPLPYLVLVGRKALDHMEV